MASAKKNAVVIGGGFGGLAAALRLRARGYETDLVEMSDQLGGKAAVFRKDGFTFDTGPTILTLPFLVEELFALHGRQLADYVSIVPCDPFYRILFDDGSAFNYTGNEDRLLEEIRRFSPADVDGYRRFAAQTEKIFDIGFTQLADYPFSRFTDMLKVMPDLLRLRAWESVYTLVSRHIRDEKLRMVFSFNPLLIGGNPFEASCIYSMIHHLEKKWGIHFPAGGMGALVQAMARLLEEVGGRIHLSAAAEEIEVENGSVAAVRLAGGRRLPASVVVSNADTARTYSRLVAPRWRKKWSDRRLSWMRYSMGVFLVYFGTDRTYPDLAHHSIILSSRYRGLLDDIFKRKVLADDFSLYLHTPTRSDPSLAPAGGECFYALSPVPNLKGKIDWASTREAYADRILASLERYCPDLRQHIVTREIVTPLDMERQGNVHLGAAFQFEPILTQSAWFRPHNVSEDVGNLFLVGAGSHPGAGIPGVLAGAKLLDRVLPKN